MLPLGNRPVIDYIVRDCVTAGITDIYFVISGAATQLRSYYSRDVELEVMLHDKGKDNLVETILPPEGVTFHYIEQDLNDGRYGTTVPMWLCRDYIAPDELVLYMTGDDVTYKPEGLSDIEQLVSLGVPALLGLPVPEGDISQYGVIETTEDGIFKSIVEKPAPGEEPSRMINVTKYVLPGSVMPFIEAAMQGRPNASGEYYISDPIAELVESGQAIQLVEAQGTFLDTGTVETWVKANQWLLDAS